MNGKFIWFRNEVGRITCEKWTPEYVKPKVCTKTELVAHELDEMTVQLSLQSLAELYPAPVVPEFE